MQKPYKLSNDGRHDVSELMLDTLKKIAYKQDDFGMDKYKEPLHHSYNYDWLKMFFEEIADGLKYIQNEMIRREVIKNYLQLAVQSKEWFYVEQALKLLEIEGTGEHKETHS